MSHPRQISAEHVLDCAIQMLEGEGPDGLSVRRIATRLGVKAPSLYHYFADKAALEAAVVDAGYALLLDAMRGAVGRSRRRMAFVSMSLAYRTFAMERPELYRFMMSGKVVTSTAGKAVWTLVLKVIGMVSGDPDDTSGAVALWSFLHGFASLEGADGFGESGPAGGFEAGLDALLAWCERGR